MVEKKIQALVDQGSEIEKKVKKLRVLRKYVLKRVSKWAQEKAKTAVALRAEPLEVLVLAQMAMAKEESENQCGDENEASLQEAYELIEKHQ